MTRSSINRVEDHLITELDRLRAPRPRRITCPKRDALDTAYNAYARLYGYGEAKAWAAARAHYRPDETKRTSARTEAETVFAKIGGAE